MTCKSAIRAISCVVLPISVPALVIAVAGCGGTSSNSDSAAYASEDGLDPSDDPFDPEAFEAAAALDEATGNPKLNVRLTKTLDGSVGNVKAPRITKAELLDERGKFVANANIVSGAAKFPSSGLARGAYFVRINGLVKFLIPTRIDRPSAGTVQYVGKKLRTSVIGSLSNPTYRIQTFPKGGVQSPAVKYSDGTTAIPRGYGYAIIALKTSRQKYQTGVLGMRRIMVSTKRDQDGPHNHKTWLLGPNNHGKDGGDCADCHGNLNSKPASYASIDKETGWCFQCHSGPSGPIDGMVHPRQ